MGYSDGRKPRVVVALQASLVESEVAVHNESATGPGFARTLGEEVFPGHRARREVTGPIPLRITGIDAGRGWIRSWGIYYGNDRGVRRRGDQRWS